ARGFQRPVQVVAVAVGVAPGYVAIAADDDRRQSGEGDALYVNPPAGCGGIRPAQARAEPEVGRAQAQVHVVGDDRAAVAGERAGYGEVVAARQKIGRRWRAAAGSLLRNREEGAHAPSGWGSGGNGLPI